MKKFVIFTTKKDSGGGLYRVPDIDKFIEHCIKYEELDIFIDLIEYTATFKESMICLIENNLITMQGKAFLSEKEKEEEMQELKKEICMNRDFIKTVKERVKK